MTRLTIGSMRYAEDSAAVGHAAKRAAETLAVDFYWALEQSRSLRMSWQERDMPFRERGPDGRSRFAGGQLRNLFRIARKQLDRKVAPREKLCRQPYSLRMSLQLAH